MLKECRRCGKLIQYPNTYCDICKKEVDNWRKKKREAAIKKANNNYNKKRDKKYIRFYNSSEWRILSNKYLSDHGYKCGTCGKFATEVHHIKPIQTDEGWTRRLDYNNLICQCVECHNKKHNRFIKRVKYK